MQLSDNQINDIVCCAIKNYLNTNKYTKLEIFVLYPEAVELGCAKYKEKMNQPTGISALSEGGRNVTFIEPSSVIDNEVKALLPRPFIRLF